MSDEIELKEASSKIESDCCESEMRDGDPDPSGWPSDWEFLAFQG